MSGPALAADDSATRRHRTLSLPTFLGIVSLLFSSGCEASNATPSVGKTELDPAHVEIDAGVIFGDRSSYLCIPLSRCGISSSESIETITSSCECVKPSLVRYSESATTAADGLLFEFIPGETSPETAAQPMRLAVEVQLTMVDGQIRTVTVHLLDVQLHPANVRHR